jgi:hypothetical protein
MKKQLTLHKTDFQSRKIWNKICDSFHFSHTKESITGEFEVDTRDKFHIPIPGFSNYGIDSLGNIINYKTGKHLKPYKDNQGRYRVTLYRYKKGYKKDVDKLFFEIFGVIRP